MTRLRIEVPLVLRLEPAGGHLDQNRTGGMGLDRTTATTARTM